MLRLLFAENARRKTLSMCSIACGVALFCSDANADIYKWITEDGVTNYSGRKPQVQVPVETIVEERSAESTSIAPEPPADVTLPSAPPPRVCLGKVGATAVGTLSMLLNRAYIASIPEFVTDNSEIFASDDFYVCLDAIFENALLHEQITGAQAGTGSPDAPLAVMLESSSNLADALRELNDGTADEWQKIFNHMQVRRPRLDIDIGTLTELIRSVVDDAQANAEGSRLQAGTP